MLFEKFKLYFHTLRYLKFKQIIFRFKPKNKFFFPKFNSNNFKKRAFDNIPEPFIIKKASLSPSGEFNFLNKKASFKNIGWNFSKMSHLWHYNQNYFDWLISKDFMSKKNTNKNLINSWIDNNPLGKEISWDPYPTSLRIVNWIKYSIIIDKKDNKFILSLFHQSNWLLKNLEWHLLANHLFSNAKALIFSGLFFKGKFSDIFLNKGINIINDQMEQQILSDGGHFELSPMYHSIILEDLLDILNLFKIYSYENKYLIQKINEKVILMLHWLSKMTFPGDNLALFNDTANGISSKFSELCKYASSLGIDFKEKDFKSQNNYQILHLKESGYIRFENENFISLMDVGSIGSSYQPGHAHADCLSFEVSIFGEKLITNSGTSTYDNNSLRDFQRSTISHNTVSINETSSSEVWNSFRVAKRANPFDLSINYDDNKISCKHDGYKRFKNKLVHSREWTYQKKSFLIEDNIIGNFKSADCFFYFHPECSLKAEDGKVFCFFKGKVLEVKISSNNFRILESFFYPEFGEKIKNKCLKIGFDSNLLKTSFRIFQ